MDSLVELMKSSKTALATSMLIQQALKNPKIYFFGEIYSLPCVEEVRKDPNEKAWADLLEIFTYGTFDDYKKASSQLPPLSDTMVRKLQLLSIVTICSQGKKTIQYSTIMQQLHLSSAKEVEGLVILCIYDNLLDAQLNQQEQYLNVNHVVGRDERNVKDIVEKLDKWVGKADLVLKSLVGAIQTATHEKKKANKRTADIKAASEAMKATVMEETEGNFARGEMNTTTKKNSSATTSTASRKDKV